MNSENLRLFTYNNVNNYTSYILFCSIVKKDQNIKLKCSCVISFVFLISPEWKVVFLNKFDWNNLSCRVLISR